MACQEITEESIKNMTDNDLGFFYEDCCELDHPLKLATALEMLRRLGQPSNKSEVEDGGS